MNDKDEELILKYINGVDDSFRILINRYTTLVYNFVYRFVGKDNASDVTQDVFIKVWKNIKNFDIEKSSFKTWLFTIVRNTTIDFLRKKKSIVFSSLDSEDFVFSENIRDENPLSDEEISKLEEKKIINKYLDKLNEIEKTIIMLHFEEELTFKEIGEVLNKPLNTVKSYYRRGLLKLKEFLKEDF
jgi:RNA polymerase sigma-70 factor, ECF subfamily